MFDNTVIKTQSRAMFKALRFSYGLPASESQQKRAAQLAPSVRSIRPAVYYVGSCVVDLWRGSCSCQQARRTRRKGIALSDKPCAHLLALYLVGEWSPMHNPTEYLKSVGVERPEIIAVYARVPYLDPYQPGRKVTARIYKGSIGPMAELSNGEFWCIETSDIKRLMPFYE